MKKVTELHHPLVEDRLTLIRDVHTATPDFRRFVSELSTWLAYEVSRDFPVETVVIETPVAKTNGKRFHSHQVTIVPVLRAGLGMVDGMLKIFQNARVGHLGYFRDHETLKPVEYYVNLPNHLDKGITILIDPMLATGGSAVHAVEMLKKNKAKEIRFACLIASPDGINTFHTSHPDVPIFVCAIDQRLNEKGYIVPGLGDAGDRLFGTLE